VSGTIIRGTLKTPNSQLVTRGSDFGAWSRCRQQQGQHQGQQQGQHQGQRRRRGQGQWLDATGLLRY
jgi:hypothetical protein